MARFITTKATFAASLLALSTGANAQTLDEGCRAELADLPVTMIVPNSPGGGYDTYLRTFAPFLGEVIGTDVRVANMPGGGGLLAATAVAQQDEDELVLLLEDLTDLANHLVLGSTDYGVDDFAPLGMIISEPRVWLARPDIDFSQPIVAGAPTLESSILDIGMAARAAALDVTVIAGFDGSSEQAAAILRGDTDFTSPSLGTGLRRAAGTELEIALVLTDAPIPELPGVPALGDLVRANPESDPELAEIVTGLANVHRALLTATSIGPDRLACVRAATDIALAMPEFAAEAEAQGRAVEPVLHEDAIGVYEVVTQAWVDFEDASIGILEDITP